MAVEGEITGKPAFYLTTGSLTKINRSPPPSREPVNFGMDNFVVQREVDENGSNNEGTMQRQYVTFI